MRRYTVAVAAVAIEVDPKWVDNILSHYELAGVEQTTQGRSRRLDVDAVLGLAVVARLSRSVRIPISQCIALAQELAATGEAAVGEFHITCDIAQIRSRIVRRLAAAAEEIVAPRRGRPRQRRAQG